MWCGSCASRAWHGDASGEGRSRVYARVKKFYSCYCYYLYRCAALCVIGCVAICAALCVVGRSLSAIAAGREVCRWLCRCVCRWACRW